MNISEWREQQKAKHRTFEQDGLVIECRPANIQDLVIAGNIPNDLLKEVQRLFSKKGGGVSSFESDDMHTVYALAKKVVMQCAVSPRVTEKPGKETLGIYEVSASLVLEIFSWSVGGADQEELKSDLSEQGTSSTVA